MKKLSSYLLSSLLLTTPLMAELIDVSPDGSVYRDRYGADFSFKQKQANPWEMDPEPGKCCLSGLSKKKTSDIVIYPTPRK